MTPHFELSFAPRTNIIVPSSAANASAIARQRKLRTAASHAIRPFNSSVTPPASIDVASAAASIGQIRFSGFLVHSLRGIARNSIIPADDDHRAQQQVSRREQDDPDRRAAGAVRDVRGVGDELGLILRIVILRLLAKALAPIDG